jgi:hypothetical protein
MTSVSHFQPCLSRIPVIILMAALSAVSNAQLITTATVNGVVTDSSGSVVPDATVTLSNQATRVSIQVKSNSDGSYVAPSLPVGTYTVTASKAGFQTYRVTNVELHPAIVETVNLVLTAGEVQTQIEVQASAAKIETSTAELSSQVSATQVETLPLNGRNYQSLSALMPGVTNTAPGTSLGQGGFSTSNVMSINGMGTAGAMYYVDGIWNMNTGDMFQTTITPNPDTIQEVRVLQNNYGVAYTLNGAAVVLVETKSGTSTYHGSAFEYFRNDDLNARNFFNPSIAPLKQNIFGYTLGGPVYIPGHFNKDRRKTFFFFSEQWSIQHAGQSLIGATPTDLMRQGIFSGTITDPTTHAPFPQSSPGVTQIPANRLNAGALALVNALAPLPNNPAGGFNNYINNAPQILDQRDDEIKVDEMITEKFRLTGEYFDSHSSVNYSNDSILGSPFNTVQSVRHTPNSLAELQLTQIWSPNMVNSTSVSMNRYVARLNDTGIALLSQVPGFKQVLPYSGGVSAAYLPQINPSQGWSKFGVGTNVPQPGANNLEDTLSDNWSLLRGNHQLQAGVQILFGTARQTQTGLVSNGQWSFTGQATGNAMADFFLGVPASLSQYSNRPRTYVHYVIDSPYIQDQWRVNRHFTLTLGLRFSYMPNSHPQPTFASIFSPAQYNAAQAPGVSNSGTIIPTANYNPLNGLLINGAGAPLNISDAHKFYWGPSIGFAWDVLGDGKTALRGGYGITHYSDLVSNCSQSCTANPPFIQSITLINPGFPSAVGGTAAAPGVPTLFNQDQDVRAPQIQTYSLSLQRDLRGWFISVAGAGNIARHMNASYNINQPLPAPPYDFNPLINSGSVYPYLSAPYLGYGAINTVTYDANAYWNALELSVRHPLGHNFFVSAGYTWQHDLMQNGGTTIFNSGGAVQDSRHPRNDYGNSAVNVPQIFTFSGIWSLPWLRNAHGWKGTLLGGWQYSDITTIQTGFSMSPGLSTATKGLATRPNTTGQPVEGPQSIAQWFNTAAFAAPAAGYFGNAGPGTILGPGTVNFDMSFYKTFRITEHHAFEFRGEFFNIINHPNFSGVQTSVGAGNYGRLTAARDPRIAEAVLRYTF